MTKKKKPDDRRINVRVAPDDYKKLEVAADALGLTVSAFMRMAAFDRAREVSGADG